MKLLKRLTLILSLIMLASVFTACSKDSDKEAKSSKKTGQSESKNDKEDKDSQEELSGDLDSKEDLSDNLYDYEIFLENKIYTLPTDLSEFTKNGWKVQDLDNEELIPNLYETITLSNSKKSIRVDIMNFGLDVQHYTKCLVTGVYLLSDNHEENPELVISKGITIGSTYSEVIKAYGSPSLITDDSSSISYESDEYQGYYNIYFTNEKVNGIRLNKGVAPEGYSKEISSVNAETLDLVKNYKAPSNLGDNLYSYQVKIDNALYKLPVPMQELEKNGWKLKSNPDEIIPGKNPKYKVELTKNNQTIRATVMNYSNFGAPIKYCFVTTIVYSDPDCISSLELPKGITEKSTLDQVIAAYGQPRKKDTSPDSANLTYIETRSELIEFEFENNKLTYIVISYSPETLK